MVRDAAIVTDSVPLRRVGIARRWRALHLFVATVVVSACAAADAGAPVEGSTTTPMTAASSAAAADRTTPSRATSTSDAAARTDESTIAGTATTTSTTDTAAIAGTSAVADTVVTTGAVAAADPATTAVIAPSTTSTTDGTSATSTTTAIVAAPPATSPPVAGPAPGPTPMAPAGPLLPPPPPTPPALVPLPEPGSIDLPTLTPTVQTLTPRNLALSVSVWRDGRKVYGAAAGADALGSPVTTDTPFVLASVSKLVTMLTVVRLAQAGLIALDAPAPWEAMGVPRHPWWDDVTPRELMWHTAGMRVAQNSWLNQPGPCAVPLAEAMVEPPREWRGRWVYSNGNYCALGMLIEHVTSQPFDAAARTWLFDGIGVTGPHLTSDGLVLGDGPYALDVRRLDRLGGAGTWMGSTDDIAALLSAVTDDDRAMLTLPAVMVDQYGWGHTGSVDGARACSWVMEGGRTVLSAVVSGNRPSSGGQLCDALVPALAHDLGVYAGPPVRLPD